MNNNSFTTKQEKKRQKIIKVAVKLFVQHGIQGTSMQLLAKRADIATGSIYNYFKNKETLIREIFQMFLNEEREYVLVDYDETKSIRDRFEYLIRRSALYKFNNPDTFHFRKQYVHTPGVMHDMQSSELFSGHPMEKLALEAQAQGLFKPLPLQELFYFAHAGLVGFICWKLFSSDEMTDEDIENLINLCWDSLLVD